MKGKKKVIGLVEIVKIRGKKGVVKKRALFDTGATRTSVDMRVAAKAGIGPIISSVKVRNAGALAGYSRRPVAKATIVVKGKTIHTGVNIEDREGMSYSVLIGRDIIHNNFLIDVSRTHTGFRVGDVKDKDDENRSPKILKVKKK